jgi:hypothetical protein
MIKFCNHSGRLFLWKIVRSSLKGYPILSKFEIKGNPWCWVWLNFQFAANQGGYFWEKIWHLASKVTLSYQNLKFRVTFDAEIDLIGNSRPIREDILWKIVRSSLKGYPILSKFEIKGNPWCWVWLNFQFAINQGGYFWEKM